MAQWVCSFMGSANHFKGEMTHLGNTLSALDQLGCLSVPPHIQCIQMEKEKHLLITEQSINSNLRMLLTFKMCLATPLDTTLASKGMLIRHELHTNLFPP